MVDLAHLKSWIGRSETYREQIAPFPSNALAATLDRADKPYETGSPLPPLWHWLHFLPIHPLAERGEDGHASRGGFLPPVPLPRRMWAGSRLIFAKPLMIGETVSRTSTITKIEAKDGRTGTLVFVTARHDMRGDAGGSIDEEHDIVYREAAIKGAPALKPMPAPDTPQWERQIVPDPVLLFRYSALTFNSHRIHYDQPYVTAVEGYPGLIVHGPLLATMMLDGLRRAHPDRTVKAFTFRAISPVFDVAPFFVCGRLADDGASAELWVRHPDGSLAMQATADLV
jgi:3-methylfumaryl-CoA hydratase